MRFPSSKQTLLLVAAATVLSGLKPAAAAQNEGDEPPGEVPPSAQEIATIEKKARSLLYNVIPRTSPPSTPYARQPDQPAEKLELDAGTIQWGNLFTPSETVALVNLSPPPKAEDEPENVQPRYLCVFAWHDGHWAFLQFLGNVYNLSVHHRRDKPAAFLQGSRRTGRYEGDHLSWYYEPKSRRLMRTDFEDWGPFYLVGNYLILGNGFARLAHDTTHWVYAYKDG